MDEAREDAPIGRLLWNAAHQITRAFDEALLGAGVSHSAWAVLVALKKRPTASQRQIAADVGIQGATLTHHLAAMETDGLLTRRRDPANRRVHIIELTQKGEAAFVRIHEAASAFDRRLRTGIPEAEIGQLRATLNRMIANIG